MLKYLKQLRNDEITNVFTNGIRKYFPDFRLLHISVGIDEDRAEELQSFSWSEIDADEESIVIGIVYVTDQDVTDLSDAYAAVLDLSDFDVLLMDGDNEDEGEEEIIEMAVQIELLNTMRKKFSDYDAAYVQEEIDSMSEEIRDIMDGDYDNEDDEYDEDDDDEDEDFDPFSDIDSPTIVHFPGLKPGH